MRAAREPQITAIVHAACCKAHAVESLARIFAGTSAARSLMCCLHVALGRAFIGHASHAGVSCRAQGRPPVSATGFRLIERASREERAALWRREDASLLASVVVLPLIGQEDHRV